MEPIVNLIKPDFATEEIKIASPWTLRRIDGGDARYYVDQDGEFHISVTTFVGEIQLASELKGLHDWKARVGQEEADKIASESADFGTFMHDQFSEFFKNKELDYEQVKSDLKEFMQERGYGERLYKEWLTKIYKFTCSLAQFVHDHNVEMLASEFAVSDSEWRLAGTIDFIGTIDYKDERVLCIIDWKSGAHFHASYELQLLTYQEIWNKHMPAFEIQKVFNWRPKNWRKRPTYQLKDQTGKQSKKRLNLEIKRFKSNSPLMDWESKQYPTFEGGLRYGEEPDVKFRNIKTFI